MATLADVARQRTSLSHGQVEHLQVLVAEWGFLADLALADLLLYVPTVDNDWVVVAQVRPATARTIYVADYVGDPADSSRPLLDIALSTGGLHEGDIDVEGLAEPARMLAIPVRFHGDIIAVLARETSTRNTKMLGELERTYVAIFERFAVMVAEGSFPSEGPLEDSSAAP
ncbi:MAG: putative two-component histidine kinase, partial [Ilumatobacteraceae bacterium]|nr:putative two-component histidine kinase [Ilumatobacteraceae bacterium]